MVRLMVPRASTSSGYSPVRALGGTTRAYADAMQDWQAKQAEQHEVRRVAEAATVSDHQGGSWRLRGL
jgi:hypothetical protein